MTRVTWDLLNEGKSRRGAWSRKQLAAIGVKWPLRHGWQRKILGKLISDDQAERFLALRDAHLPREDEPQDVSHMSCLMMGDPT